VIKKNRKNSLKQSALKEIENELRTFVASPLFEERIKNELHPVPGEGDPSAKIMCIGEASGKKEAETGKPFVGSAGKILDELLSTICISREEIFITSIVKDRPPKNRDPLPEEILAYAPFLDRQIAYSIGSQILNSKKIFGCVLMML
jgi:DNA polymerase